MYKKKLIIIIIIIILLSYKWFPIVDSFFFLLFWQVGKGISKVGNAKELASPHWLEAVSPMHA